MSNQMTPAKRPANNLADVQKLLDKFKSQIAVALPRHMTPERMIRVALTAVSQTPLLQKCNPLTVCGAVVQASILGLEPNSMLGEAYLIPYWNSKGEDGKGGYDCQLQVGYKGHVKLARNSGEIAMIDAQPVHEDDDFDFEKGDTPYLKHKWAKAGERGEIIGYWAGFRTKDNNFNFEYWTVREIEAHRDKYSKGAYKTDRGKFVLDADGNKILQGPWKDSPDWMYRKTPLIQALKLAPKSVQQAMAIALDEAADSGIPQRFTVDVPLELQPAGSDGDAGGDQFQAPQRKTSDASPVGQPNSGDSSATYQPAPLKFESWAEVNDKNNGDGIAPGLGLRVFVGGTEFVRPSTEHTWSAKK